MKCLRIIFILIICTSINADDVELEIQSNIMLKMLREMVNQTSAADSLNLPANASSIRENITDTFSCENRTYGYYADVDNDCQIFHVCLPSQTPSGRNITYRWSFICPKETIFNQEVLVCTRPIDSIPCEESPMYYDINNDIGKIPNNTKNNETNTQTNQHNTQGNQQNTQGNQQNTPGYQQNPQGNYQNTPGYQQYPQGNYQNTPGYQQNTQGNQQNTPGYQQNPQGSQQNVQGNQHNTQGYQQNTQGNPQYTQTNQQNTQGYQQTNQQNQQGYQNTKHSQKPSRRRPDLNKQNYMNEKLILDIVNKEMQDKVEDFGAQNLNVENVFPIIEVSNEFEPSGIVNKDRIVIDDDRLIM